MTDGAAAGTPAAADPLGTNALDAGHVNAVIRRLGSAHRSRTAHLLARFGVSIGQELLVLELDEHGERTQAELAQKAGTEASTITIAVRKLEAAGLVERRPSASDGRAMLVSLTPAGREIVPEIRAAQELLAEAVQSALPEELSLADLLGTLTAVTEAIHQVSSSSASRSTASRSTASRSTASRPRST